MSLSYKQRDGLNCLRIAKNTWLNGMSKLSGKSTVTLQFMTSRFTVWLAVTSKIISCCNWNKSYFLPLASLAIFCSHVRDTVFLVAVRWSTKQKLRMFTTMNYDIFQTGKLSRAGLCRLLKPFHWKSMLPTVIVSLSFYDSFCFGAQEIQFRHIEISITFMFPDHMPLDDDFASVSSQRTPHTSHVGGLPQKSPKNIFCNFFKSFHILLTPRLGTLAW